PGRSTLITSAPRSPRSMVQNGPARTRERSRMRKPARGEDIVVVSGVGSAHLPSTGQTVSPNNPYGQDGRVSQLGREKEAQREWWVSLRSTHPTLLLSIDTTIQPAILSPSQQRSTGAMQT